MRILLTELQVTRLKRRLGLRSGLIFEGLPIEHAGSATREFSDTPIGKWLAEDLLKTLQTLDETAKPDNVSDSTVNNPIWFRK